MRTQFQPIINEYDYCMLEPLNIIMLQGSIASLMKPYELKPLVMNENASIDGSLALTTNRRAKARDVVLQFLVKGWQQGELAELNYRIDWLCDYFRRGVNNSGVNQFFVIDIDRFYFLVFMGCDKINNIYSKNHNGHAIVSFKFKELDPTRHW